MKKDRVLFNLVDKKAQQKWKRFSKYYKNDSKPFINRISRDYEKSGKFPVHVLKMIKKIPLKKYDSAICILRGGLAFVPLFEALGWKIHYVISGRVNEVIETNRFSKSVDRSIRSINKKKVLLIENNSLTSKTPVKVVDELSRAFKIQKPDMFLDYFLWNLNHLPGPYSARSVRLSRQFKGKYRHDKFGKIYEARNLKVGKKERDGLIEDFIRRLK
jgi:hypothetical protein